MLLQSAEYFSRAQNISADAGHHATQLASIQKKQKEIVPILNGDNAWQP